MKLYMVVIGGKPEGRHTEQHDVFFGIANSLKELVPKMKAFWPELANNMHIDSWREVQTIGNYRILVEPKSARKDDASSEGTDTEPGDSAAGLSSAPKLYFVNLGGYKPDDMEEYHYKQLVVADSLADATRITKASTFWKHHDSAHIDDKYGVDVDDIYEIQEVLDQESKANYTIQISPNQESAPEDRLEVGYLKITKLLTWD